MNWLDFIREEDIQVFTSSENEFSPNSCVYIISYNIATRLAGLIEKKGFKIVISDEAHYLKSRDVRYYYFIT
jgi:superfamily II DNA or RNA helicase